MSDVQAQAPLLERLLDEAAALHNRTQDPSVDPQAQESLQEAYNNIRDQSEVCMWLFVCVSLIVHVRVCVCLRVCKIMQYRCVGALRNGLTVPLLSVILYLF